MRETSQACHKLLAIVRRLRGEGGCPWDRAQTIASMACYLRNEHEELQEAIAKIANGDKDNLREELGDVMFVLVLIAAIAEEKNLFSVEDVFAGIAAKLRRRHPHVFERRQDMTMEELDEQWRRIKAREKSAAGESHPGD